MEKDIVFNQPVENIKEYRRVGNSIDGIDLIITYKDGTIQRFRSYDHMFQETVNRIKK